MWTPTKLDETALIIRERKVLRKIYMRSEKKRVGKCVRTKDELGSEGDV